MPLHCNIGLILYIRIYLRASILGNHDYLAHEIVVLINNLYYIYIIIYMYRASNLICNKVYNYII